MTKKSVLDGMFIVKFYISFTISIKWHYSYVPYISEVYQKDKLDINMFLVCVVSNMSGYDIGV